MKKWSVTHGDLCDSKCQLHPYRAPGDSRSSHPSRGVCDQEGNEKVPCGSSWHDCRLSPGRWIVSCIVRVKSLNEWQAGKAHLVTVVTVGPPVTVTLCVLTMPVVDVNGACVLTVIRNSADSFFHSTKSALTPSPGSQRVWVQRTGLGTVPVWSADPSESAGKITVGTGNVG